MKLFILTYNSAICHELIYTNPPNPTKNMVQLHKSIKSKKIIHPPVFLFIIAITNEQSSDNETLHTLPRGLVHGGLALSRY
jgi:hypothetical protein